MKPPRLRFLSKTQLRTFQETGCLAIEDCFSARAAAPPVARAYQRLGVDPADPRTWKEERASLGGESTFAVKDFAPKAWDAICDLIGGESRILEPAKHSWSDSFVIRFPTRSQAPYAPPCASYQGGWHIDGELTAVMRLDCPEIGLLTYALWTDTGVGEGGTFFARDSVGKVMRFLAEHPAGVVKTDIPAPRFAAESRDFMEFTGKAGTVLLAMPHMVHAESPNYCARPRFLTTRRVELRAPMRFDGPKEELSPVERFILNATRAGTPFHGVAGPGAPAARSRKPATIRGKKSKKVL